MLESIKVLMNAAEWRPEIRGNGYLDGLYGANFPGDSETTPTRNRIWACSSVVERSFRVNQHRKCRGFDYSQVHCAFLFFFSPRQQFLLGGHLCFFFFMTNPRDCNLIGEGHRAISDDVYNRHTLGID